MAKWKSGSPVQAAIREKDRQDRKLDKGNFLGALGYKGCFPDVGTILPRPSYCTVKGARVWVF